MNWFRSLRRTSTVAPPVASRRRFFAGAGAVAGTVLFARPSWATGPDLGIEPGTLVDASGQPLDRAPMTAEPFLGQILMVPYTFAPRGWANCEGQLLSIAQNTALFSLLGTTFGGDGQTTFALPDLRGRVPLHPGQGPGLSNRTLGESGGTESVTLTAAQIPQHAHTLPEVQVRGTGTPAIGAAAGGDRGTASTSEVGGSQPHNNMPPYLALRYVIALFGIYPSRD
jgi:microcystin-dependent protein